MQPRIGFIGLSPTLAAAITVACADLPGMRRRSDEPKETPAPPGNKTWHEKFFGSAEDARRNARNAANKRERARLQRGLGPLRAQDAYGNEYHWLTNGQCIRAHWRHGDLSIDALLLGQQGRLNVGAGARSFVSGRKQRAKNERCKARLTPFLPTQAQEEDRKAKEALAVNV